MASLSLSNHLQETFLTSSHIKDTFYHVKIVILTVKNSIIMPPAYEVCGIRNMPKGYIVFISSVRQYAILAVCDSI